MCHKGISNPENFFSSTIIVSVPEMRDQSIDFEKVYLSIFSRNIIHMLISSGGFLTFEQPYGKKGIVEKVSLLHSHWSFTSLYIFFRRGRSLARG